MGQCTFVVIQSLPAIEQFYAFVMFADLLHQSVAGSNRKGLGGVVIICQLRGIDAYQADLAAVFKSDSITVVDRLDSDGFIIMIGWTGASRYFWR